ncbi:MAG TPA: hypothetical protein VI583_01490 [Cyclobacteriaceae bacterium]|nr:hypothetical protein [Cyclobacteriaceae bacterium]
MKILIPLLIASLILFSCRWNQSSDGKNLIDLKHSNIKKFHSFLTKFGNKELPFELDSITISEIHETKNYYKIDNKELKSFLPIADVSEMAGSKPSYIFYCMFKLSVDDDKIGLVYLYILNPEIPYDDIVDKIILAMYSPDDKFLNYKELALYELHSNAYILKTCVVDENFVLNQRVLAITEDEYGTPKTEIHFKCEKIDR